MPRILLVDDDDLVRTWLRFALEEAGHAVTQAVDGNECLRNLSGGQFDLVILDVLMPEREGIETLREIRARWPAVPVLVISGGDRTGFRDYLGMAAKLGAADTIAKPFAPKALSERLRSLVSAN